MAASLFADPEQEIDELMQGKMNDLQTHIDIGVGHKPNGVYLHHSGHMPAEAPVSAKWTIKWAQNHFNSGEAGQQEDNEQEAAHNARAAEDASLQGHLTSCSATWGSSAHSCRDWHSKGTQFSLQ